MLLTWHLLLAGARNNVPLSHMQTSRANGSGDPLDAEAVFRFLNEIFSPSNKTCRNNNINNNLIRHFSQRNGKNDSLLNLFLISAFCIIS